MKESATWRPRRK